jgi:hypothetical protein
MSKPSPDIYAEAYCRKKTVKLRKIDERMMEYRQKKEETR